MNLPNALRLAPGLRHSFLCFAFVSAKMARGDPPAEERNACADLSVGDVRAWHESQINLAKVKHTTDGPAKRPDFVAGAWAGMRDKKSKHPKRDLACAKPADQKTKKNKNKKQQKK